MNLRLLEYINYTLFGIIIIIQVTLIVIPFVINGKLYYKRNKGFLNKFPLRGKVFFVMAICLVAFTFMQFIFSNEINDIKEDQRNAIVAKRDSLNYFNTTELLAKYGLKVDSKNDEIVKILRDSSLRKTTIINGALPYLKIDNLEMTRKGDTTTFKVWYCSKEAVSYNIDVLFDIYSYNNTKDSFNVIGKNLRDISIVNIPKDQCLVSGMHGFIDSVDNNEYLFRLHGTYSDAGDKIIQVDYVYLYQYKQKLFGGMPPDEHIKFLEYLENSAKKKRTEKRK